MSKVEPQQRENHSNRRRNHIRRQKEHEKAPTAALEAQLLGFPLEVPWLVRVVIPSLAPARGTLAEPVHEHAREVVIVVSAPSAVGPTLNIPILLAFLCLVRVSELWTAALAWTCREGLELHARAAERHRKDARAHLLHPRAAFWAASLSHASHGLGKHLFKRVDSWAATATTTTTTHSAHLRSKRLRKQFFDPSIAKELSEELFRVNVVELRATTSAHFFAKHVVVFAFGRIAETSVRCTHFLERLLGTRCPVLVRVHSQCKLQQIRNKSQERSPI